MERNESGQQRVWQKKLKKLEGKEGKRERKAAVSRNMAAIAGCDKARLQSYRSSRAKACFGRISADIFLLFAAAAVFRADISS